MQLQFTAAEIVAITQPKLLKGATDATIRGLAGLVEAQPGDLSFLGNAKYKTQVEPSRASILLLPSDFPGEPAPNQLWLLVENPSVALARVCARIEQALWPKPTPGIHPTAVVDATAQIASSATVGPLCIVEAGAVIGERTYLQAQAFVGRRATIAEDCWLMPGAIVATECVLGKRVRLQPGAVIGADGFGYEFTDGRHVKVPQVGQVVLGDDVEIGANATIDRARFSRTIVGEGTKIDNLVMVAHNVVIGRHCLLCSQVGIAGSTTLEDYVVLGGQSGVGGHVTLGKGTKAGGGAGITSNLPPGSFVNGTPAIPYQLERRIAILQQRLPDLFKRVASLEEQLIDAKKSSS